MTTYMQTFEDQHPPIDGERVKHSRRLTVIEIAGALAAFIGFCLLVLLKHAQMLEPDDYAYRASIVALSQGHLSLSNAQYVALGHQLGSIQQWVHLSNGRWMSEKNPGYPFFAVFFYWIHALRAAPLFAGAICSTSLFVAARKWLGRWAGLSAVVFYLASGMALAFAYRATMPTFTDASLIGAGAGALLWAMISIHVSIRRRTIIGLLGFLSIEFATFMRYTDVVLLIVAAAAVLIGYKAAHLRRGVVAWWLGSVALFGAGVLIFDTIFYGHPFKTGYSTGEITFSWGALSPNLKHMPAELLHSIPALVLGLGALIWMVIRIIRNRKGVRFALRGETARRDAFVGLFLAAGWLGIWAFYLRYNWTAQQGGGGGGSSIHDIRFYVPAIALIALLATWFVMQLPKWIIPAIGILAIVFAVGSYHSLVSNAGGPGGGHGPGGFGGPPGRTGRGYPDGAPNGPRRGGLPGSGNGFPPSGNGPQRPNGANGFPGGGGARPPKGKSGFPRGNKPKNPTANKSH